MELKGIRNYNAAKVKLQKIGLMNKNAFFEHCRKVQAINNHLNYNIFVIKTLFDLPVSYPMLRMTHPFRNFFVLTLFCVYACLYG